MGWTALATAVFEQSLEREFADPPVDFRPSAFWRWLNGSMSKEQITRDLLEKKVKGMGALKSGMCPPIATRAVSCLPVRRFWATSRSN